MVYAKKKSNRKTIHLGPGPYIFHSIFVDNLYHYNFGHKNVKIGVAQITKSNGIFVWFKDSKESYLIKWPNKDQWYFHFALFFFCYKSDKLLVTILYESIQILQCLCMCAVSKKEKLIRISFEFSMKLNHKQIRVEKMMQIFLPK